MVALTPAWPPFPHGLLPEGSRGIRTCIVGTRVEPGASTSAQFFAGTTDACVLVEGLEAVSADAQVPPALVLAQVTVQTTVLLTHACMVQGRGRTLAERLDEWEGKVQAEMRKMEMTQVMGVFWDVARGRTPPTQAQLDAEARAEAERRVGPKPEAETFFRVPLVVPKGETLTFHLRNPTTAVMSFAAHLSFTLLEQP